MVPLAFGAGVVGAGVEGAGVVGAGVEGAGVAGAAAPAIVSTCPILMRFASVIPFSDMRFLVVVPNLAAIPLKESPATTLYVVAGAAGAGAAGAGVVGAGAAGAGAAGATPSEESLKT